MATTNHVGQLLRDERIKANVAQAALGQAVGVSTNYIGLIEAGRRRPSGEVLEGLIVALDCNPKSAAALRRALGTTPPGRR